MTTKQTSRSDQLPLILLIEDDPDHAELMRHSLAKSEVHSELRHLSDGQQALDYLLDVEQQAVMPKLILLDLNLPKIDGWQILTHIKQSAYATVPVVILSSSSNPDDISRSTELHANSYIAKPSQLQGYINLAHDLSRYWLDWNTIAPLPARA